MFPIEIEVSCRIGETAVRRSRKVTASAVVEDVEHTLRPVDGQSTADVLAQIVDAILGDVERALRERRR